MCPTKTNADAKSAPQPAPVAYPPSQPVAYPPPQPVAYPPPQQAAYVAQPQPQGPQVVVMAPPTPAQVVVGQWTTGLCDCFDDPFSCIMTLICPCVTFGQVAEIVDRGSTPCFCAASICFLLWYCFGAFCCYTCTYRSKLRGQFGIPGGECGDCCIHCWCAWCAFSQEYRELKNRNLNPSIGWVGNQQKMQQPVPVVVAPGIQIGMTR